MYYRTYESFQNNRAIKQAFNIEYNDCKIIYYVQINETKKTHRER